MWSDEIPMSEVVTLFADKRWKAVIDYRTEEGSQSLEHYFEEISELHLIIEHGPDWNQLILHRDAKSPG
jgi:hypothetical protein